MKKSLIALAALSAFATTAQAQSSVTVYGVLDIGNTTSKYSDSTGASNKTTNTGNGDGALATSRLGFRGTEDLGGGLKANFMLEYDLTDVGSGGGAAGATTTGQGRQSAAFGARESWAGLSDANMGELKLGRMATASHGVIAGNLAGAGNNIVGSLYSAGPSGTVMAPQSTSIRPHNVYADRLITYISPRMSGVQATVQYGEQEHSTSADASGRPSSSKFSDYSLTYVQGKLSLGAAKQKQTTTWNADLGASTAAEQTALGAYLNNGQYYTTLINGSAVATNGSASYETTSFGGNYNFGVAQPFVLRTSQKANANSAEIFKRTATEVGVRVPVGAKTLAFASMMDGEFKYGAEKQNLSGYQLGAIYNLSKRTGVYAITGKAENEGTGSNTGYKAKVTQTAFGVRHSF